MSQIAFPIAFSLLVWWFSTGIILLAIRLSRRTYPLSVAVATILLGGALWILWESAESRTVWSAYQGFTGAVVVWGFVELTFLTGMITGVRKTVCPSMSDGWTRARYATETIIYHELALVVAGLAIWAATWHGNNPTAVATFAVLWIMRLSSKLNLFLGVRTLNDELLPPQLAHLRSYFRHSQMNALYPISMIGSAAVAILLTQWALAPTATEFETASYLLLASLLALALLEHAFMMIPVPIAKLWGMAQQPNFRAVANPEFNRVETSPIKPT